MVSINREPVQIVEIDIDYCSLTYGTGACNAVLGTSGVRKCFNTFQSCQDKDNFDKTTKTLRFIQPRTGAPKDEVYFPCLENVSAFSSTVNINGSNPKLSALGKRAKATITLSDFPYHDGYLDKYRDERRDGTAQTDEGGYDPQDRGTFFGKLKARFPFYAGRPMRIKDAYLDNGALTNIRTRNYIITDIQGPNSNGTVTIEGKDVLALAENKKAYCPVPSRGSVSTLGQLGLETDTTEFILVPEGIGSEYPASGYAVLGDEVVTFTRSGDDVTLTGRGLLGTEAEAHDDGTTFQEAVRFEDQNVDDVLYTLLNDYTDIDPSFMPTTDWATEIDTWMGSLLLNTTITEPTPVTELVSELSDLGLSVWWDDVDQEIKIRAARPPFGETVTEISDSDNIKAVTQKDEDEDRVTQIHFYSVQSDPTRGLKDKANYDRIAIYIDSEAESANAYDDTRVREIFCRWLNVGNDIQVGVLSNRILSSYATSPRVFTVTVDAKDRDIQLGDIVELDTRVCTDFTGNNCGQRVQVFKKTESKSGHEVEYSLQKYFYQNDSYAVIMPNSAPDFGSATADDRFEGAYLIDEDEDFFADGTPAYRFI
jgi:hypothetical protein